MKINKKVIYSFGILGAVAAPVATVISCGDNVDTSNFTGWPATLDAKAYKGENTKGYIDPAAIPNFPTANVILQWSTDDGKTFNATHNLERGDVIILRMVAATDYTLSEDVVDSGKYTIPDTAFENQKIDMSAFTWKDAATAEVPAPTSKVTVEGMKTFVDLPGAGDIYANVDLQYSIDGGTTYQAAAEITVEASTQISFKLVAKPGYELTGFVAGTTDTSGEYGVTIT